MPHLSPLLLSVLGLGLGGGAGFAWYRLVGCRTGACPLMSTWWSATLLGAIFGLAMANR